jgi:glycine dehydrogenase subunit 2
MKPQGSGYHAARWNEPLITEMGGDGQRGILPPEVEDEITSTTADVLDAIPAHMRRQTPPALPELSQPQVLRHFVRLSQMTLGADVTPDMSSGTCTMKYSPKVNDALVRLPAVADTHPLQDVTTLQGTLEVLDRFGKIMGEISGMDEFSFQAGSGAQGIYVNACIIRAYHESRGEGGLRDEIITTAFSHPSDAATPAVAGFKVITLMPGPRGYPELDALKAALSDRTAGLMLTNPEDTGLFNPAIDEFVRLVHEAGGLCAYDQANANGLLGITRAADTGFDMCQFNLHKTFSAPHSAIGQGCGAVGVTSELARFLPAPVVTFDGHMYGLDYDRPDSIGKVRSFLGNVQTVIRAYAWVMSLGGEGLKAVAETAVLNNNYLAEKLSGVRGLSLPFPGSDRRLEQVRYSWEDLAKETGVSTTDLSRRITDYGLANFMESHVPRLVPEPFTLEPTESYTLEELDEYVAVFEEMSREAYEAPEMVTSAPHRAAAPKRDDAPFNDPQQWAMTWRAYRRKQERT